jgi:hypothetical protein
MRYIAWAGYDLAECEADGTECTLVIWNGTGTFDFGGDWQHGGFGSEESYAKYDGTNGLDATNFVFGQKITFTDTSSVNVDEYDLLSMWINLKEWETNKDVELYFDKGNKVNLSTYLESYGLDEWQRVLIPLEAFGLTEPIELKKLTYNSTGAMGFYLDDVEFAIGATVYRVIPIERPEMDALDTGRPRMGAEEINLVPKFGPPQNI